MKVIQFLIWDAGEEGDYIVLSSESYDDW